MDRVRRPTASRARATLLAVLCPPLVLAVALLVRTTATAQQQSDQAPDRLGGITRLNDLGFPDSRATGTRPVLEFFFPGPGDFRLGDHSRLTLHLSHSNLLVPTSAVTVVVNGRPLRAILLDATNVERAQYDIDIPKDLVHKDFNLLRLEYSMTLGSACEDSQHPALFATVLKETQMLFDFADSPPRPQIAAPNLSDFPYPFFRGGYPVVAPVALVLPDEPTGGEVAAAYRLAATVTQRVGFDLALLEMRKVSQLTAADLADHQLIVLGTADRQPLIAIALRGSNAVVEEGRIVRLGTTVEGDTGLLTLVVSPWNPDLRVMTISGGSEAGLARAVDALTSAEPSSLLSGPEAILVEPVASDRGPQQFTTAFRFAQLGLSDHTVLGDGKGSFDVTFNAPALAATADARLDLLVSTPQTIDRRRSNIIVQLNGELVETVQLKNEQQRRVSYQIKLPRDLIRVGQNVLRLQTALYSPDPTGFGPCYSTAPERLWTIYHSDSAISLSAIEDAASTAARATLAALPVPFVGPLGLQDTTFVVDAGRHDSLRGGMLAAIALARRGSTRDLAVQLADSATATSIGDRHVIAVGLPPDSAVATELAKVLPLVFRPGGSRALVDQNATLTEILDSARVGALQEAAVPWAPHRKVLALSGTDDTALQWATEALVKRSFDGNVALLRSPTQVNTFTLQRRTDLEIQKELDQRFAVKHSRVKNLVIFLPVVGGALLLLVAWTLLPRLLRRRRGR